MRRRYRIEVGKLFSACFIRFDVSSVEYSRRLNCNNVAQSVMSEYGTRGCNRKIDVLMHIRRYK